MDELIKKIITLKESDVGKIINSKIQEFKELGQRSNDELFKEMCFCMLTANFNAEKSIKIQTELGNCFLADSKDDLAKKLKEYGHRYPNVRAEFISESIKCKDKLEEIIRLYDKEGLRDWIVKNVKGLGYKEASHFLRNIGFDDYAIIDFHIVDILTDHKIINKPKTLTKGKYLEIENLLRNLANKAGLTLAELDLYLWYMETGKILK